MENVSHERRLKGLHFLSLAKWKLKGVTSTVYKCMCGVNVMEEEELLKLKHNHTVLGDYKLVAIKFKLQIRKFITIRRIKF